MECGLTSDSKAMHAAYMRKWNKAHPDKVKASKKAYYLANKEKIQKYNEEHKEIRNIQNRKRYAEYRDKKNAIRRTRYISDPAYREAILGLGKIWRQENREKVKVSHANWCAKNAEKVKEYQKEYRLAHKEKLSLYKVAYRQKEDPKKRKEQARNYYLNHREEHLACDKIRYEANPQAVKDRARRWRIAKPERVAENNKIWKAENAERARLACRTWKSNNPERVKMANQLRRAKKRQVMTEKFLNVEIYERDNWICRLCHKKVNPKLQYPDPMSASLDHIIPLSKGGAHSRQNTQLAHLICNVRAGAGGIKQGRLF